MNQSSLKDAWAELTAYSSYVLACHIKPDGDCLGAALALGRALRSLGKDVTVICQDPVPENYRFLPESDTIVQGSVRRDFDVGVLIDSDQPSRVGNVAEIIASCATTARIDHHLTQEGFGDIKIVQTDISSTSELITELFYANEVSIDSSVACMLLTGIIFDTGAFKYSSASSRTFEIVSQLMTAGARPANIIRSIFESKPLRAAKLLGRALSSMRATEDGVIVWAQITVADFRELGVDDNNTEGIVNTVAAISGPRVVMLLRETEPGTVRVSLRSRDQFDVNKIAVAFGGGGHAVASGCTIQAGLDKARELLIAEVRRWMAS